MVLAKSHTIRLEQPDFRYRTNSGAIYDPIPYTLNEYFRRNCKDPYAEKDGKYPKNFMAISFLCKVTPHVNPDASPELANQKAFATLQCIARDY